MKILVVDDNDDILDTTALVLELDGHEVVTLASAKGILEACRVQSPDLVLQDISMPGLDLHAHLDAMAMEPGLRDVPVLIFSAQPPDATILRLPSVVGFLAKPFALADLRAWIDKISG